MEKIKVVDNLIELSKDNQLLTVDMDAIACVQQGEVDGSEIILPGGNVIEVDQDYEDIIKAWEDYYAENYAS